jgi:hypothetical protein
MTAPLPMAATSQRFSLEPLHRLFQHHPVVFVIGHRDHDITGATVLHQGKEKDRALRPRESSCRPWWAGQAQLFNFQWLAPPGEQAPSLLFAHSSRPRLFINQVFFEQWHRPDL